MAETCTTCGLPNELCVCDEVRKDTAEVVITTDERSHGCMMTVVKEIPNSLDDVEGLASSLKSRLACGGTVKEKADSFTVELQGNHVDKVSRILSDEHKFTVEMKN